jgi:hypothetical protein
MLRYARIPGTRFYRVEVSGWDVSQTFFVVTCDLLWSEEQGKRVTLHQNLPCKTVILVRLLEPEDPERSHPVVYHAELVGKAQNGMNQFRLSAVVPRLREEPNSVL